MKTGKKAFLIFLHTLFLFPLFAQNNSGPVSFSAEISRLEKIAGTGESDSGAVSRERFNAFIKLAGIYRLSGNSEAALKAYEGALVLVPGDGRALLEQSRLLLSLGSYEKADAAIKKLLASGEGNILIEARYLGAQLEAFKSANTGALAALAEDPVFAGYRGRIYYTLWKLTGLSSWKNRLAAEFPQNPEAKIAAGSVEAAAAPLWLLYGGRSSVAFSPVEMSGAAIAPAPTSSDTGGIILQTGLFSREENAGAMAERLKKAGFKPEISRRSVPGGELWAVSVPGGSDMNAERLKLKDAGFESFPVF